MIAYEAQGGGGGRIACVQTNGGPGTHSITLSVCGGLHGLTSRKKQISDPIRVCFRMRGGVQILTDAVPFLKTSWTEDLQKPSRDPSEAYGNENHV